MKKLISIVMSVLMASTFAGCKTTTASSGTSSSENSAASSGSSESSAASSSASAGGQKYSFAFLTNTLNNTFQSTIDNTLKTLCQQKGYGYVCLNPDYDVNKQLNQMSDAAGKKYSAVFVIPVDSQGIHQGLEGFEKAGIPVINIDTPVVSSDLNLVKTVIATDAYQAGTLVGQQMAKDFPNGGKIAILDFPENESCVNRVKGFMAGLGSSKSKFKVVSEQDGKATVDASMPLAEDILQANPDLKAFFCINDPSSLGAVAALKLARRKDVGVYSIDASPDGKAALLDGTFTRVAAQVPIEIAQTALSSAEDLLQKKTIKSQILLPSYIVTKEMAEKTKGQWQ